MANLQVFQTLYHTNFCISTGIKTTANFLITDIETASFFASHCIQTYGEPTQLKHIFTKFSFKVIKLRLHTAGK